MQGFHHLKDKKHTFKELTKKQACTKFEFSRRAMKD